MGSKSYVPGVVTSLFNPTVSNPLLFQIADNVIGVIVIVDGVIVGILGLTGVNSTVSGKVGTFTVLSGGVIRPFVRTLGFIEAFICIGTFGSAVSIKFNLVVP